MTCILMVKAILVKRILNKTILNKNLPKKAKILMIMNLVVIKIPINLQKIKIKTIYTKN